jgi:hypothetical protein
MTIDDTSSVERIPSPNPPPRRAGQKMTNAPTNEICIELAHAYSIESASRLVSKLEAAAEGHYMDFRFVSCPAGGFSSICALSRHEDAATEGRDALLMTLAMSLMLD